MVGKFPKILDEIVVRRAILRTSNKDGETFTLESYTRQEYPKGSKRVFLAYDENGQSLSLQDDVMRSIIHILVKENYMGSWRVKEPVSDETIRIFVV